MKGVRPGLTMNGHGRVTALKGTIVTRCIQMIRSTPMALKVGIVGMGGIGNTHARCYKNDSLADLVAVCDVITEKADAAAEKWGVQAFYNLREMLAAEPDLDIVDVTTSGYENGSWHFEPA